MISTEGVAMWYQDVCWIAAVCFIALVLGNTISTSMTEIARAIAKRRSDPIEEGMTPRQSSDGRRDRTQAVPQGDDPHS